MSDDPQELRAAIREAARLAFTAVRLAHPSERFYYFALVTTEDGLRPGPSAASVEGLARVVAEYHASGHACELADLRWSEADSPYDLVGDEYFVEVERLFRRREGSRRGSAAQREAEVRCRFEAMEGALADLDREGFFGHGAARHGVVINVVAPGDEGEEAIVERAARLNPPESLAQLRSDFGIGSHSC